MTKEEKLIRDESAKNDKKRARWEKQFCSDFQYHAKGCKHKGKGCVSIPEGGWHAVKRRR